MLPLLEVGVLFLKKNTRYRLPCVKNTFIFYFTFWAWCEAAAPASLPNTEPDINPDPPG